MPFDRMTRELPFGRPDALRKAVRPLSGSGDCGGLCRYTGASRFGLTVTAYSDRIGSEFDAGLFEPQVNALQSLALNGTCSRRLSRELCADDDRRAGDLVHPLHLERHEE